MKLSNREGKLLRQASESTTLPPTATPTPDGADLALLKGWGDRRTRHDASIFTRAEDTYEPVSFVHPDTGRRVYGYVIAAEANGDARIDLGDDTYAIVPGNEIRRIGDKQDREWLRSSIKASLSSFDVEDGVRADFHVTGSLVPVGDEYAASISYSTGSGKPSVDDVMRFAERQWPNHEVEELEESFPGRIGLILKAVEVEGAMSGAVGGEVLEVLDPEDVVEKTAAPLNTSRPTSEIADSLLSQAHSKPAAQKAVAAAISYYMANGGAAALVRSGRDVSASALLRTALPMVAKGDSKLWRQISEASAVNTTTAPQPPRQYGEETQKVLQSLRPNQPEAAPTFPGSNSLIPEMGGVGVPNTPVQVGPQNTTVNPPSTDALAQANIQQGAKDFNALYPELRQRGGGGESVQNPTASKRSAAFGKVSREVLDGSDALESHKRPLVDMAKYNMPSSPKAVMASMHFSRLVKSGIYMLGTVKWDKKLLEGASEQTAKNAVMDFVRTKASRAPGGTQDLGLLGRVHLTSYKPGEATVQFQSSLQGAAPTQIVAPTERAEVDDFES